MGNLPARSIQHPQYRQAEINQNDEAVTINNDAVGSIPNSATRLQLHHPPLTVPRSGSGGYSGHPVIQHPPQHLQQPYQEVNQNLQRQYQNLLLKYQKLVNQDKNFDLMATSTSSNYASLRHRKNMPQYYKV